jgi:hypothetical protein
VSNKKGGLQLVKVKNPRIREEQLKAILTWLHISIEIASL